jgi:hypothetical protein
MADRYHLDCFEDKGSYYYSTLAQGTEPALEQRVPFLNSTSLAAAFDYSTFETPPELADRMRKRLHIKKENPAIEHGHFYESINKDIYELVTGRKVLPVNMGVSKRDPRRAGTPDGLVDDDPEGPGIVEFKCPYGKMYPALMSYINGSYKIEGCGHIMISHILQMFNNMEIFGRKWCDYSVLYVKPDELPHAPKKPIYFRQRIYFTQSYWDNHVVPMIEEFFQTYLPDFPKLEIKAKTKKLTKTE